MLQNNAFHLEEKKKNLFHLGNLSEKVLLLSFFFLGHSVESTSKLFVWLISSWTGNWQSAPYVWTIHNPSEELHNHSRPHPSFRRVGDYAVRPILVSVWRCKVMSDAVQLPVTPPFLPCLPATLPPPPLCPAPPELAL